MAAHHAKTIERYLEYLTDAEVIAVHRTVSRYARAAYGRTERYQQNYANGMIVGRPKVAAAREKITARSERD